MNKEIKIKVFNKLKEQPDLEQSVSLDTFDNLFHFYTEITDIAPSSMKKTLKGITRLPDQIINKITELIDQEFQLLIPVIEDKPIFLQKVIEKEKSKEEKKLKAKEKQKQRQVKYLSTKRDSDPLFDLRRRIDSFTRKGAGPKTNITTEQFFEKFGKNPVCYLTGQPINLNDLKSFALDHIIPRCQGGSNELSNMGLCSPMANTCKSGYSLDQFIVLCKQISSFHS